MGYTTSLGYTPVFSISKDGADITSSFSDRLLSITINSVEGGGESDTCDILLDDRDWQIAIPSIGENSATLHVFLGYKETALNDVGTFEIDLVDLSFTAKSMLLHGNSVGMSTNIKAPQITHYESGTVSDIVGKLAAMAGVTPNVDPVIGAYQVEYLNQHSTGGHLLRSLESRFDGLAKFSDGQLSFTQRGSGNSVSGQSIGTVTLDGADIADIKVTINNKNSYSSVKTSYWDKVQHKLVWLQSNVPGDPASTVPFLNKRAFNTQDEAQQAADAQMKELNRYGSTGSLTMSKGDASIRGGSKLTITSCRDGLNGDYVISSAVHTLVKDQGLTTRLEFYSEDGAGAQDAAG